MCESTLKRFSDEKKISKYYSTTNSSKNNGEVSIKKKSRFQFSHTSIGRVREKTIIPIDEIMLEKCENKRWNKRGEIYKYATYALTKTYTALTPTRGRMKVYPNQRIESIQMLCNGTQSSILL